MAWSFSLDEQLAESGLTAPAEPRPGDCHYFPATVLGAPGRVRVASVEGGRAKIFLEGSPGQSCFVPVTSFPLFLDDLRGRITVSPGSGDPALDELAAGRGSFLGKGGQGIIFRVGDEAVKASTTTPTHPFGTDHQTPEEAARLLREDAERSARLRDSGVPVAPARDLSWGARHYVVMPFLEVPPRLTPAQLALVRAGVAKMHGLGWALNDRPHVGLKDGQVFLFDLGQSKENASPEEIEKDRQSLDKFEQSNGQARFCGDEVDFAVLGPIVGERGKTYWLTEKGNREYKEPAPGTEVVKPGPPAGPVPHNLKVESPEKVRECLFALTGRHDVSHADILALAGNPSVGTVHVRPSPFTPGEVQFAVEGDHYQAEFALQRQDLGNLHDQCVLHVEGVTVAPPAQGRGIGAGLVINAVDACRKLGVKFLTLDAAGNGESRHRPGAMNGYYTWPRMGFDGRLIPSLTHPQFKDCQTVLQLLARPGGKEHWLEQGHAHRGVFDATAGSASSAVLAAYLKERKQKMGDIAPFAATSDLSATEEKVLDSIWEKIQTGGWGAVGASPPGVDHLPPAPDPPVVLSEDDYEEEEEQPEFARYIGPTIGPKKGKFWVNAATGKKTYREPSSKNHEIVPPEEPGEKKKEPAAPTHRFAKLEVQPEALDYARRHLGPNFRPEDFGHLAGAPPGAKVYVQHYEDHAPSVKASFGSANALRVILLHTDPPYIANRNFEVAEEDQGKGIGATMLATQVEHAARWGLDHISTTAAGQMPRGKKKAPTAGFYAWATLGYDGPLTDAHREALDHPYNQANTIHELFAMPGGRAHWKKHGFGFRATFDLKEGSRSRAILRAYLAEKGLPPAKFAMPTPLTSDGGIISDEDEAALERVWEKVQKDGWASLGVLPPSPLEVLPGPEEGEEDMAGFAAEPGTWVGPTVGPRRGVFWQHQGSLKKVYKEPKGPGVVVASPNSPREEAVAATEAAAPDYFAARKSAVPNAGEDIAASARHKRNAWRGLEQAEQEGTAGALVTRANLLKNEPPDIASRLTPSSSLACLAAKLCLDKFPSSPDNKWVPRRATDEDRKKNRAEYLAAYRELKDVAEQAASSETDPQAVLNRFANAVKARMSDLRLTDRYSPLANALSDTWDKVRTRHDPRWYRPTSAGGQLFDFAGRLKKAYPGLPDPNVLAGHVRDVLGGESFDKTFGSPKGEKGLSPADLYVKTAERVGGPAVPADTVPAGTSYMIDTLKMRGVQYGNSVTDDERQHHLKMASEALADLTDVLGLPPGAASLGGKLGIAFGARGKGNALAHYEPDLEVINLTRKGGVGSLAHEWGHAMDNYLGKLTTQRRAGMDAYLSRQASYDARPNNPVPGAVGALNDLHKQMEPVRRRMATWLRENKNLIQRKADYWLDTIEVFARTFESYVGHKLAEQGRKNTYLAGVKPHPLWPTPEEVKALAPTLDRVVAAFGASAKFSDDGVYRCPACDQEYPGPVEKCRHCGHEPYGKDAPRCPACGSTHSSYPRSDTSKRTCVDCHKQFTSLPHPLVVQSPSSQGPAPPG